MPQACRVCNSANRNEVEKALKTGVPYRRISAMYGVSRASVSRHAEQHVDAYLPAKRRNKIAPNPDRTSESVTDAPPEILERDDPFLSRSGWRQTQFVEVAKQSPNPDLRLKALREDRAEDQHQITVRELNRTRRVIDDVIPTITWEVV